MLKLCGTIPIINVRDLPARMWFKSVVLSDYEVAEIMRLNEVRILWARSGNRCAYPQCRTEMAPDGSKTTVGEIAHIVAKSPDGPRGASPLTVEERDEYDNLVLLCPTHHKIVDDSECDWSVERLRLLKAEHEKWVANQLEVGGITVHDLQGTEFLTNHIQKFVESVGNVTWVYAALTPLSINQDAIDAKSERIVGSINQTQLPSALCVNSVVNVYHTRPSEFGLQNEDFREVSNGKGHRIEVFRNGHVEMRICIEGPSRDITNEHRRHDSALKKLIYFNDLRDCLESEIMLLARTWNQCLPFYNMVFSAVLTGTEGSNLAVPGKKSYSARSNSLMFNRVVDRTTSKDELLHSALERIVESYGWILPKLREINGEPSMPQEFAKR